MREDELKWERGNETMVKIKEGARKGRSYLPCVAPWLLFLSNGEMLKTFELVTS